jgi:hypothetical protein
LKESEGWYAYEFNESRLAQGTIVVGTGIENLSDRFYAILNPECDLENEKADYINLVAQGNLTQALQDILSGLHIDNDHWLGLKELSRSLFGHITKRLTAQINGQHGARWFFAPSDQPIGSLPLIVFDLQQIFTLDRTYTEKLLSARKAILRSPFKEALVTKIHSYLTRVGTDDGYKYDLCLSILSTAGLVLPEARRPERTSAPSISDAIEDTDKLMGETPESGADSASSVKTPDKSTQD